MSKKFVIRIEKYEEEKLHLSNLKLKDNELVVVDDGEDYEHKLHTMMDKKFNGDKTDVVFLDVHEHKIGFMSEGLSRILENTQLEADPNGDVRGFVIKVLRTLNKKDSSFISFIKYSPYFQKCTDGVIHLLFDRYNLDDFIYRDNLVVYGEKSLLTLLTLSRYYNITYTNLTENSKEGFLFYKGNIEVKE